jgi:hypothetical protein
MLFSKLTDRQKNIVLELYYFYGVRLLDLEPEKNYPVSNKTYRRLNKQDWQRVVDKKNLEKHPILVRKRSYER